MKVYINSGYSPILVGIWEEAVNRPPPLTGPERNAIKSMPTVTNSRTAQMVHRRAAIVAFLSGPVKGKPPYGGGWFLPPVRNLRTAQIVAAIFITSSIGKPPHTR